MLQRAIFLAIAAYQWSAWAQSPPEIVISQEDRLKVFDKTWETVNKKFYDPKFNGVDWAAMKVKYRPLADAAADKIELGVVLNRMVSELHASHADIDDGVWFGTGISYVRFGEQGEQLVVRLAYTGSPAKAAGIERGWLATSGSGDCNAANRRVTNTFRDSQGQEHKTELPCEVLHGSGDPEVAVSRMLNPTTFYVWFPGFNKTTASWFEKQVTEHSSASALVIDLRGNSGGAIEALEKCLKLLFPQKIEYAKFYGRNGKEHKLKTGGGNAYSGQVFVLTNRDTGSASEIFSAIIQETKRGVVVGRTTRGGVLGADHFNLPNGFRLHVPLYNLYTPKGIRLEGRGVIPDERVTMTLQDYQSNKDPDVDRVLAILAARP